MQKLAAGMYLPLIGTQEQRAVKVSKRIIPSSGEKLTPIGLGTWLTFDVGDRQSDLEQRQQVLKVLVENEGSVVDTSPMYGRSESVVGRLSASLGLNKNLFIATKVWTTGENEGRAQMDKSFALLKRRQLDLMQIHNLVDWGTHLPIIQRMKEENQIRYTGITHYVESAYDELERIMRTRTIDFLAVNYSLHSRVAEQRLLPLAMDKGIAVIINRPFEQGALFERVRNKPLPAWSREINCSSWAQIFLKYVLSNPAVTCVIPGTSDPAHMLENIRTADGVVPDAHLKGEMLKVLAS